MSEATQIILKKEFLGASKPAQWHAAQSEKRETGQQWAVPGYYHRRRLDSPDLPYSLKTLHPFYTSYLKSNSTQSCSLAKFIDFVMISRLGTSKPLIHLFLPNV